MTPEELRIVVTAFTIIAMMLTVAVYIAWTLERDFKAARERLARLEAEDEED